MYYDRSAHGGKFVASWTDADGIHHRKRFATVDTALAHEYGQRAVTEAKRCSRELDLAVHGMRGKGAARAELARKAVQILQRDPPFRERPERRAVRAEFTKKLVQIIAGPRHGRGTNSAKTASGTERLQRRETAQRGLEGPRMTPTPPQEYPKTLRAQLYNSKLAAEELLVLQAVLDNSCSGQVNSHAISRIAAYAKLSRRTVQSVLHGKKERTDKNGRLRPSKVGLIARRVLIEVVPADAAERRAATYRINPQALQPDTEMERYQSNPSRLFEDLAGLEFAATIRIL